MRITIQQLVESVILPLNHGSCDTRPIGEHNGVGMRFIASLDMRVSAKIPSPVFAVTIPSILVFVPNLLENSTFANALSKILGLLPDDLLDLTQHLQSFDVYDLGFTVMGAWPLLLVPVMYREFRTKQIG